MEKIQEMNEVIARFMGASIDSDGNVKFILPADGIGLAGVGRHALQYHSDWKWLMPVIEKISKYKFPDFEFNDDTSYPRTFGMISEDGEFMFRFNRGSLFKGDTLIEAAFPAVFEFVQWYNVQSNFKP